MDISNKNFGCQCPLNANIFQTIHCMDTGIASFERELPLSSDTNFNFITSMVYD